MPTPSSSVSHCSRTKVTTLARSLVLVPLFLGLGAPPVTSQVQWNGGHCNFQDSKSISAISDLVSCMEFLASKSTNRQQSEAEAGRALGWSGWDPSSSDTVPYDYANYPPYADPEDYIANGLHGRPSYPAGPGYYRPPPALPPGYPESSNFNPGILGVSLLEALSSISQYDDRKCVPRILCEVATGVIPGSNNYKQSHTGVGMNSLISLLTALDTDASPLLTFGKSALMGYANRGNPGVCYRQYPKCPRSPADVVEYLNNHNGGFFRFFMNRSSGFGYRAAVNDRPALPPGISGESDRKGTGNLKFDSSSAAPRDQTPFATEDRIFPEEQSAERRRVVFPGEPRQSKSLTHKLPSFFPQQVELETWRSHPKYLEQGPKLHGATPRKVPQLRPWGTSIVTR